MHIGYDEDTTPIDFSRFLIQNGRRDGHLVRRDFLCVLYIVQFYSDLICTVMRTPTQFLIQDDCRVRGYTPSGCELEDYTSVI